MTRIIRPKTESGVTPPVLTPTPEPTPEARRRPLVPPRAPSSARTRNKVLLSVADGKIEWDKMTSESRKAFEEMFRDPEFLKEFGLTGQANFDPEQMKAIFDTLSMIYQAVTAFFLRWPPQVLAMLAYTDEQKNMLKGPTAKLADKYAPKLLRDNQEVVMFFAIFGAVTQKNFLAATAEAKKLEEQKKRVPGPGPGPVRIPPTPADRPAPSLHVPFAVPENFQEGASLG